MLRKLRTAVLIWIAIAAVALAHAMVVGGGAVRPLLLWQLHRNGEVDTVTTYFVAGLAAIGLPSLVFLIRSRRPKPPAVPIARKSLLAIFGGLAVVFAALAGAVVYSVLALPANGDAVARIELDSAADNIRDSRTVLVGQPRPQYLLEYSELVGGGKSGPTRHYPHSLMPITRADWSPGQPVRFLLDLRGRSYQEMMKQTQAHAWATGPGFLLHGQLSDFERRALGDLGVVLADDVMVYSTDRLGRSSGWIAFAAICGIVALVCSLAFLVTLRTKPRPGMAPAWSHRSAD